MPPGTPESLNWDVPCGRVLVRLIEGLPKDHPSVLSVFGSSPLQITLDAGFTSGDVDLFSAENLAPVVTALGLGKGQSDPFIEVCPEITFIAAPSWVERATKVPFGNVTVYLAAPIDVLVGKIKRLEPKDLKAFDLVRRLTGGPSEDDLKEALKRVVDLYRPAFDEENPGGDPLSNTRRLWQRFYGHDIDVRQEIIGPALSARQEAYGAHAPDSRTRLGLIATEDPN